MDQKQQEILKTLNVPNRDRDELWESNFLKKFPEGKVTLIAKSPQVGPDQFPYMFIEITENSSEPAINLLKWISENGIGLAINPKKEFPDFVFTYGMIWNYIKSGQFLNNPLKNKEADHNGHIHGPDCNHHHENNQSSQDSNVMFYVGSPSKDYLPSFVRSILKEFLKQQGVMAPKISMISADQANFDLCFSIESFGSPQPEEHEGILQALSWFLPAHYSLAFVSEKDIPSFEDL